MAPCKRRVRVSFLIMLVNDHAWLNEWLEAVFVTSHSTLDLSLEYYFSQPRTNFAIDAAISFPAELSAAERITMFNPIAAPKSTSAIIQRRGLGSGVSSQHTFNLLHRLWVGYFDVIGRQRKAIPPWRSLVRVTKTCAFYKTRMFSKFT